MTKQEAGDERQATYCKIREAIRLFKGRLTRKEALKIIHDMANADTDWKSNE